MSEPEDTAESVAEAIATTGSQPAWYYIAGGQQCGPVTGTELAHLCASGQVLPATLVWRPGFAGWIPLLQVNANIPMAAASAQPGVMLTYSQGRDEPASIFGWWWRVNRSTFRRSTYRASRRIAG